MRPTVRQFSFRLRLPDAREVAVAVDSPHWRWSDAFTRACQLAEASYGVEPFAEIVCVGYTASRSPPAEPGWDVKGR